MSISDIMAIRGLLSGSESELLTPRDDRKTPYKFRDSADETAALAEADRILEQLREAFGDDQQAVTEEFSEIMEGNERLQAAVIKAACREMCEDPRIKKLMTKRQLKGR